MLTIPYSSVISVIRRGRGVSHSPVLRNLLIATSTNKSYNVVTKEDEGGGGDMKDTEVRGDQMGRHRISDGLNAKQYCIQ